jgi:hypothetical protein
MNLIEEVAAMHFYKGKQKFPLLALKLSPTTFSVGLLKATDS